MGMIDVLTETARLHHDNAIAALCTCLMWGSFCGSFSGKGLMVSAENDTGT